MSLVVIYDEGASPEKVLGVVRSANTPDYVERTDVLINPDISALDGIVAQKYWKHDTGAVIEYTQGEKDAQDAAEAAAADAAMRASGQALYDGQVDVAQALRAMAEVMVIGFNELRDLHSLTPYTMQQLKTIIQSKIADGSVDE